MFKENIVNPTTLKGKEQLSRMRELMGENVEKNTKNYVIELTKKGPDDKVYAIVREGHQYFIKITDKTTNILAEDFKYIGGLQNITSEAYPTYAKAIKQLNLKFINLNEAYCKNSKIDTFTNDNIVSEDTAFAGYGFKTEATTVFKDEDSMKEEVELDESEEIDETKELEDECDVKITEGNRLKISKAISIFTEDLKKKA